MIHTDTKILSLAAALLLCFGTYALAAPPEGKGKPPKGNQAVAATAEFTGDIMSSGLWDGWLLQGELIDNGDFDTMEGQLTDGEAITVTGDAGGALWSLAADVLPAAGVNLVDERMVIFYDEASGVTWKIRLDRDKEPPNRVQFKMRWLNAEGFERHLRIGWVVQAYDGEDYPLDDDYYGVVTTPFEGDSLTSAMIEFIDDPFRIDGKVPTGRGKKTELKVFSHYGEVNSAWCNMGNSNGPCVASTVILTASN